MSYYKRPETKYHFYCENCGAEEGVCCEDDDNRVLGRYCTHCFEFNLPNALEVYKENNNVTYNELLEKYFDDKDDSRDENAAFSRLRVLLKYLAVQCRTAHIGYELVKQLALEMEKRGELSHNYEGEKEVDEDDDDDFAAYRAEFYRGRDEE